MIKLAAASLALLLGGCASALSGPGRALPAGAHYVAVGSSFAAGAGIEPFKDGPKRCSRSARNYASLLAARLRLTLDDQTCGGAKTTHLLGPWSELAAQLGAVRPDTRLVTATIGGNDLNYAAYLMMASCPGGTIEVGEARVQCRDVPMPAAADYAALEANLRAIVRQVKARAPQARVVFVQYVTLVPERPCADANLPADKAAGAREIGRRLAEVTARAARAEGGEVLEMDTLSRRHGPCDAEPWSFGTKAVAGEGVLWHPTGAAHAAIADLLADRLGG